MTIALPKYLSAVVVDSTNNRIYAYDSAIGGYYTASIPSFAYYFTGDTAGGDLVQAIEDSLNSATIATYAAALNADGTIEIDCDAASWSIDWDHANTTFGGSILGIADLSAAWGSAGVIVSDYQHKHGWYAAQAVEWDDGADLENDAAQVRAKSGRIYTHKLGEDYTTRLVRHAYEADYKAKEAFNSGYENQSFQAFWRTINAGERLRYYPDASLSTYFDAVALSSTIKESKPARRRHGVSLYSWAVELGAYV